jgi:hypothetical protein
MRAIGRAIAAVWHWLGGPWRSIKGFCLALINMDRRQMRSLFSIAMLGGIIALSFQNGGLILMVRQLLKDAAPGSLFGQMALNQQLWNNIIIMVFCVSLALIVWGADYFTAKYKGGEISAGRGVDEARVEAAKRVEQAAHDERKEIEQETAPIPATVDQSGQIVPDDGFEDATK